MRSMIEYTKTKVGQAKWWPWLTAGFVLLLLAVLWKPLAELGADATALRLWIEQLGPLAPLAFLGLNVIQIVVAPIPGYPVQVMGGILFGFIYGSIYAVGGMVAGGVLAAWLGRRLGRPWLEKRMGPESVTRWNDMTQVHSFWTWWIILLIPLGDIPYFLAGLSRIRLSKFALAILVSRGPFTVLIVWAGDSIVNFPVTWVALLMAVVGLIVIIGFSQAERLEAWGQAYLSRRSANDLDP